MNAPATEPRVLFFISVMGHGRGGHFYSLRTTAEALSAHFPCRIVMLGKKVSPVIASSSVPHSLVRATGWNHPAAVLAIKREIREFRPTVLHSFDVSSHGLVRAAGVLSRLPVVMTKAGGPNPKRFFPRADHIVLFSKENADFFAAHPKFRRARRYHIPNRAVEIQDDPRRIAKARATLDPNRPTFLRIARFNPHYRESLVQAVNLVKRLNGDGAPCQLVLIGTPQIPAVYGEILALRDEHIHIFAEDEYTVEASQLLGLADFVVSTGRSIMEASSKGKVLLTPYAGGTIPVLVTPENFQSFFETNFSPRNSLADYNEEANYARLRTLVTDRSQADQLKNQSREWFDRHFSIHGAIDAYRDVYETAMRVGVGSPHPVDALLNSALSLRHYARAANE
ncbi:MAG: hypothetical protein PWP23_1242 [Candidatus Sumerlaeota bacterium]|nr:hypothetical protein [Candidatus Sumerlaeota bacterium]